MKHWMIPFLLTCLLWSSCKEEEVILQVPQLSLLDISPTVVTAHGDSIVIHLGYADEQGDIGFPDPDEPSLSVRDQRLSEPDWVHIPPVTPDLMELSIAGELEVVLPPLFLLGNGDEESTTFTLQLRDRAGHLSEPLVTPEIIILDTL